jgi:hypothetical protein
MAEAEAEQEIGLLMFVALPKREGSQNLTPVEAIPVPVKKHLLWPLLSRTPFQSKPSLQLSTKGRKFY